MTIPAYELNNHPVEREKFYAIACDPRRHVAVEACAGAGKTWMLVSRMLRALLDGAAPHEILAITFTKKAAGEMRQRLSEWLEQFAHASPDELADELRLRGVEATQAQALAPELQGLYARLLAAGRPVQIRTFHSWFAALLRNAPLAVLEQLGLPANYELLEDDARAVDLVWRRFHAALLAQPEARQDYEAQVRAHGRYQTERALEAALARRVEFTLADAQGHVAASVPHFSAPFPDCGGVVEPLQLLLRPGLLREQLVQVAQILGRANQPTFSAKGSELEQALTNEDATGVLNALLTQTGSPRKFGDKVAGIEQVRAAQEAVLRVQAAQAQHEAWLHQQRMARLTRLLIAEFAALKRERGWIDMNDVEQAALHLLADPVLGGWVQQRLDARIRHLLIDEFQDTNPLQWQALHAWLSGYAGAGGGAEAPHLFIVGDPKQSIYRFRRAEPQVFKAAQAFVRELGGDLLSCDHTRRNAPAVLDLVNAAMAQAQSEGGYEGFRAHSTESTDEGATLHLLPIMRPEKAGNSEAAEPVWRDSLTTPRETPEETLRTLECRQAAQWLAAQLRAGVPAKEIMVLARKRDRLSVMQDELRALGIAAVQPEKSELGEAPEVQDLVALIDALVSPAHDLSLARALKSPLFGVGDDDLVALALRQREAGKPWFELLCADADLPAALREAGRWLARWQAQLAALPPHDALDTIYREGDVLARFAAAAPGALRESVLANLQALLAAALQIDGGRYATPYALVRALKAGGIPAPGLAVADAVRLLTVHGAKGLEAQVVLLLDTDAQPTKAQTMSVLVDWPGEEAVPRHFIFLASESKVPPSVVDVLAAEQQARQREELNALYVAMTRARRQLVLSSVAPYRGEGAHGNTWWQRLKPGCVAIEAVPAVAPASAVAREITLAVLPAVRVPPADAEASVELVPESEESRIGQAMHRLLEWAPLGARACGAALVRRAAREFALDAAQAARAAQMAERILTGEGAWAWDGLRIDWHGNEVPIAVQGGLRRMDRLVRSREGIWWVLDYKSAARPQAREELLAQLRAYRAAVQAAYPGEAVRAAFLSAQGTVEEIQ